MPKLSISDVEHIAKLSKLELSLEEKRKFAKQLSNVIDYVEELNEVNTKDAEIMSQVMALSNVASEDKIESDKLSYYNIQKNAPEFEDGSFVVPAVF